MRLDTGVGLGDVRLWCDHPDARVVWWLWRAYHRSARLASAANRSRRWRPVARRLAARAAKRVAELREWLARLAGSEAA